MLDKGLSSVPDFNGVTAVVSQWCMAKVDRGPVCEHLEHLTSSEEVAVEICHQLV